jgi:hypothetical protein
MNKRGLNKNLLILGIIIFVTILILFFIFYFNSVYQNGFRIRDDGLFSFRPLKYLWFLSQFPSPSPSSPPASPTPSATPSTTPTGTVTPTPTPTPSPSPASTVTATPTPLPQCQGNFMNGFYLPAGTADYVPPYQLNGVICQGQPRKPMGGSCTNNAAWLGGDDCDLCSKCIPSTGTGICVRYKSGLSKPGFCDGDFYCILGVCTATGNPLDQAIIVADQGGFTPFPTERPAAS